MTTTWHCAFLQADMKHIYEACFWFRNGEMLRICGLQRSTMPTFFLAIFVIYVVGISAATVNCAFSHEQTVLSSRRLCLILSAHSEGQWQRTFENISLSSFMKSVFHCSWFIWLFIDAEDRTTQLWQGHHIQLGPGLIHTTNISSQACVCRQIRCVAVGSLRHQ